MGQMEDEMDMLIDKNMARTDSDSDEHLTENLEITSSYQEIVLIEPPAVERGYSDAPKEDSMGFELLGQQQSRTQRINSELHNHLLSQSLTEHEEIWRSLARK